jgi:hypothetical protein
VSNLSNVSDPGKPTAGIIDVCFVVDTTGSMDVFLEKTKDTVKLLVKNIREKTKTHDISVRFGFVNLCLKSQCLGGLPRPSTGGGYLRDID